MTAETYDVDDYQDDRELYGSIGLTSTALDGALTQKARLSASDMRSFNHSALFGDSSSEGNRYTTPPIRPPTAMTTWRTRCIN